MEDLIKRSDAIKALRKLGHEVVVIDKVCSLGVATEFIDAIRAIPSADRPQGRNLSEEYPSLFECSMCGASCYDTYPWDCDIKFCPNCGARMKGADDE